MATNQPRGKSQPRSTSRASVNVPKIVGGTGDGKTIMNSRVERLSSLQIRTDWRVLVIGFTGDGKTVLSLKLAGLMTKGGRQKFVILNPAAEDKYFDLFGDGQPGINECWPDVQHVTPFMTTNYKDYGKLFRSILTQGNNLTLIDETAAMSSANVYAPEMMYCYQMGRRRNCGFISITQKPKRIPTFMLDMSDIIIIGEVRGNNLKYLEDYYDEPLGDLIRSRGQYEFVVWNRHTMEPPKLMKL